MRSLTVVSTHVPKEFIVSLKKMQNVFVQFLDCKLSSDVVKGVKQQSDRIFLNVVDNGDTVFCNFPD